MTYSSHLFLLPPSCHPPPPTCWFSVSVMSQQLQNDSQAQEREREQNCRSSCRISWENAPSSQKEHGGRIGCEVGQQQLTLHCLLRSCLLLRGGWRDGRLSSDPRWMIRWARQPSWPRVQRWSWPSSGEPGSANQVGVSPNRGVGFILLFRFSVLTHLTLRHFCIS